MILRPAACVLLATLTAAVVFGAATSTAQPEEITPLPAVLSFASKNAIPLEGFAPPSSAATAERGDSVTALITLRDSSETKQWLARFTIATPTEEERAASPPRQLNLNATSGRVYRFSAGAGLALDILTVGPFAPGKRAREHEQRARTLISPDFLGIGLDETCRSMLKLKTARLGGSANAATLSEEEERSVLGFFPALAAFFEAVQKTPGLREILWDLTDKPSVWSVVKNRGRVDLDLSFDEKAVSPVDAPAWVPAGAEFFRLNLTLSLNKKPALICSLFVTAPKPPLLTSAGIVGIVASPPSSPSKRLDVRILAARHAPSP